MDPEVANLRANYYLGCYDFVIREVKETKSRREYPPEVDVYYYRALMESDPGKVIKSINNRAPTALQALKQLATYRTAPAETKELVIETIAEWLRETAMSRDVTLQLVACEIYLQEGKYRAALEVLSGDKDNLDKLAMGVHLYLQLDRADLAQKNVQVMLGLEDDDCMTLLCSAWVAIAQGQETKLEQAKLNLEEVIERWGPSVVAYNALASCAMLLKDWTAAFGFLKRARETAKKMNQITPAETLLNTAVCLQHLNKPRFLPDVYTELETSHPRHPYHEDSKAMEDVFSKCAANYAQQ